MATEPTDPSSSSDSAATQAAPAPQPISLPDLFGPDPSPTSPVNPLTGIWYDPHDPQFLIQWSLEQAQDPQLAASAAAQEDPPTTYKARVRIFQEAFETTLAAARPIVPFSLRDALTSSIYLQGSLVLVQQPSSPPVLLVKNMRFSGFQQPQVMLFPSTPQAPGGAEDND